MNDWVAALVAHLATGTPVVRMAVATVRGSAPREAGASLLYWRDRDGRTRSQGSIGGGRLEARAMHVAEQLLQAGAGSRRVERFTLGATLGQCCGGAVELFWECFADLAAARPLQGAADQPGPVLRYVAVEGGGPDYLLTDGQALPGHLPAADFPQRAALLRHGAQRYFVERLVDDTVPLWLYGAGHVGRALVQVLVGLPFRVTWVDSRPDMLAEAIALQGDALHGLVVDEPSDVIADAPAIAWHLIMTHCHDQDLRLCEALLARGAFAFCGLIGSDSKAARFRHRLLQRGHSPAEVARIVCPIGAAGIRSKVPAAIAVAVAAQLLQLKEQHAALTHSGAGMLTMRHGKAGGK